MNCQKKEERTEKLFFPNEFLANHFNSKNENKKQHFKSVKTLILTLYVIKSNQRVCSWFHHWFLTFDSSILTKCVYALSWTFFRMLLLLIFARYFWNIFCFFRFKFSVFRLTPFISFWKTLRKSNNINNN